MFASYDTHNDASIRVKIVELKLAENEKYEKSEHLNHGALKKKEMNNWIIPIVKHVRMMPGV